MRSSQNVTHVPHCLLPYPPYLFTRVASFHPTLYNYLTCIYALETSPTATRKMTSHSLTERYALESSTTDLLAGVFFGISAALLVIALPLALCNYCRSRRRAAREGWLEI
ncbi:hypothetical protein GGR55DRAFT_103451 [Xylaria sp. FL0064]|nr:hypothetical protein GGR55DRAFT_103451 [Xylaria sp. FL0064]